MLRSNSKSLGNHVVSPEEEKKRLQWEVFQKRKVLSLEWKVFYLFFKIVLFLCEIVSLSGCVLINKINEQTIEQHAAEHLTESL